MLDEVHLFADGSLPDDVVARLEDLEAQLGEHGRDKVGIGVGEQGHGGHQLAAVEVDDLLRTGRGVFFFIIETGDRGRADASVGACVHFNQCKSWVVSGGLVLRAALIRLHDY